MTIKEIDSKIARLKAIRKDLEWKEIKEFKENAVENIGRCFDVDDAIVKVIGVPQENYTRAGNFDFNPYQYPALYILNPSNMEGVVPFFEDTLFSGAWGVGHNFGKVYTEITPVDFNDQFVSRLEEFKNQVLHCDF